MATTAIKERRLPLRDWEVRAVREGRKTQFRRVVKGVEDFDEVCRIDGPAIPGHHFNCTCATCQIETYPFWRFSLSDGGATQCRDAVCPFGVPGDRLWVAESMRYSREHDNVYYCADNKEVGVERYCRLQGEVPRKFISSVNMPRWASRTTLENAGVRLERLQEISEEDVIAEGLEVQHGTGTGSGPGFKWDGPGYWDGFSTGQFGRTYHAPTREGLCCCNAGQDMKISPARCAFRHYWEATDGKSHPWLSNPWVWCVSLRIVESD